MFVAMADESGANPNSPYFAMAAYIARHDHWRAFNNEWREALSRHRIQYFHAWEFAGRRNIFKDWTEDRRRALMNDLLRVIMSRPMYALGAAMRQTDFYALPAAVQQRYVGPYMMCFFEIVCRFLRRLCVRHEGTTRCGWDRRRDRAAQNGQSCEGNYRNASCRALI